MPRSYNSAAALLGSEAMARDVGFSNSAERREALAAARIAVALNTAHCLLKMAGAVEMQVRAWLSWCTILSVWW